LTSSKSAVLPPEKFFKDCIANHKNQSLLVSDWVNSVDDAGSGVPKDLEHQSKQHGDTDDCPENYSDPEDLIPIHVFSASPKVAPTAPHLLVFSLFVFCFSENWIFR
jgi:hypothetical protein